MKTQINDLMQREMSRKEFIAIVGLGLSSVFGLSTIIKLLNGKPLGHSAARTTGYGSSSYGGHKPEASS